MIEKLAANPRHKNIVAILRHGWLGNVYFFDMERCVFTLESFIRRGFRTILGERRYLSLTMEAESLGTLNMWEIVRQITSGLNFIHGIGEIHRDLKPTNGTIIS